MKKKDPRRELLKLTKETPEARKKRVSSGIRFRATVMEDKRKRRKNEVYDPDGRDDNFE